MFFAIQTVAPDIIAAGKGSIINFGSNSWRQAVGGMPAYTTAKAAVHGMTRSFARDLGKHRIRGPDRTPSDGRRRGCRNGQDHSCRGDLRGLWRNLRRQLSPSLRLCSACPVDERDQAQLRGAIPSS
jgi:hypothetical protein